MSEDDRIRIAKNYPLRATSYERVLAKDIHIGDYVTKSRLNVPHLVVTRQLNASSVWLGFTGGWSGRGYRIRPGLNVKFWRVID